MEWWVVALSVSSIYIKCRAWVSMPCNPSIWRQIQLSGKVARKTDGLSLVNEKSCLKGVRQTEKEEDI